MFGCFIIGKVSWIRRYTIVWNTISFFINTQNCWSFTHMNDCINIINVCKLSIVQIDYVSNTTCIEIAHKSILTKSKARHFLNNTFHEIGWADAEYERFYCKSSKFILICHFLICHLILSKRSNDLRKSSQNWTRSLFTKVEQYVTVLNTTR